MYKKKNVKRITPEINIHTEEIGYGDDCTCDCANCMKKKVNDRKYSDNNNENNANNVSNVKNKKSRVLIRGTLGLTDDDKYVFGCDAKIDDEPIETIFSKNLKRISINKNNEKNKDDNLYGLQGFQIESTREKPQEPARPSRPSQATQVNLLLPSSYKYDVQSNFDNKRQHFQNASEGVTQIKLPSNDQRENNVVIITIQSNDSAKPRSSNSKVLSRSSGSKVKTKRSVSKTSEISFKQVKQKPKRFQVRNILGKNNRNKVRSSSVHSSQEMNNPEKKNFYSKTNLRGQISRNSSRNRSPTPKSNNSNSRFKSAPQSSKPSRVQSPERNLRSNNNNTSKPPPPKATQRIKDQSAKSYISPINKNPPKQFTPQNTKEKRPSNQSNSMSVSGKRLSNQKNKRPDRNSDDKNIGPKTIEERDAAKQNLIQKYTEYFKVNKTNNNDKDSDDHETKKEETADDVINKMFSKLPWTELTVSHKISKNNMPKKCQCANNCGGVNKFY